MRPQFAPQRKPQAPGALGHPSRPCRPLRGSNSWPRPRPAPGPLPAPRPGPAALCPARPSAAYDRPVAGRLPWLPGLQQQPLLSPWRHGVPGSQLGTQREWRAGLDLLVRPSRDLHGRASGNYLDKKDAVKAPKSRQNGTLLVFDPKEKVMIDPSKPMSQKCCFGPRPRLTNKLYSSPAQISLGVANTFSTKKEASSKKIEDKVSLKSTENKPSSRSVENKDVLTNRQSDPWSSSYLKGEAGKDTVLAKQEKVSEYCLQDVEEKLSDSTDGDGEEDTNDEDEEGPSKKETRAPLELMAEFLRAEMGRDYQLAKKLCQMILIYEPENPVAKEFFSLIEEILLKEKAQKREEDDEDSEEATSSESDAESSEDGSEDSSDECEDGS
ncbi:glutamate-rich protein 2 isoform X4 [Peromyscus eremicus]|uniref:glutamate-rich protein 2 isoform X4 n=1 Tax=Peromyscus eremicus TaxID=42410 RepID=UPI0027DB13E7|nr:glutamate-rich protein 2 isoform X4 [Peromyscus eremicus]